MEIGSILPAMPPVTPRQPAGASQGDPRKELEALEKQKSDLEEKVKNVKNDRKRSKKEIDDQVKKLRDQIKQIEQQIRTMRQEAAASPKPGSPNTEAGAAGEEGISGAPAAHLPAEASAALSHPLKFDEYLPASEQPEPSPSGLYRVSPRDAGAFSVAFDGPLSGKDRMGKPGEAEADVPAREEQKAPDEAG